MTQPLDLNPQDSGTEEAPIVYRARQSQEVRLVEGRVISSWKTVTDAGVLARIDEQARGNVLQADLRAQGVDNFGEMRAGDTWGCSSPGLELFFQDEPMTLARWPNQGFERIGLYASDDRASWPVLHAVLPKPTSLAP
jgi:hypothetical protein